MYPLICKGGYGVPMTWGDGKHRLVKVTAVCSDESASAQLQLVDTSRLLPSSKTSAEKIILDLKRVAACQANIEWNAPDTNDPLVIRDNLFPMIMTNLVAGSVLAYVK